MEYGSIERELRIDAAPEVVYEVISRPEHIRDWWNAETNIEATPGAIGELVWRDDATAGTQTVPLTVVEADPPRRFSFRWTHGAGEVANATNSFLVTFELAPSGSGTVVRFTETGFREMGWEAAVLEAHYNEHAAGWDEYLPRLHQRVIKLVSAP
jgi:uncharacterized protein YndB with AHSA1/START domain